MKNVILSIMLVIATSPAYSMTHKEKQEQQHKRHQHLHMLHKENKILNKWMEASEKNCKSYRGDEFHACYIRSMKENRSKSNVTLSPESEKTFNTVTKTSRKNNE